MRELNQRQRADFLEGQAKLVQVSILMSSMVPDDYHDNGMVVTMTPMVVAGPARPAWEEKRWFGGKVWSGLQVSSHFLPLSPSLNLKICLQVIWTNMNPFFGKKAANGVQVFHLIAFVLTKSSISSGNFPPKFPTRLHPSIVCLSSRSNLELQRTEREVLMPSLNKEILLGRLEAKGV